MEPHRGLSHGAAPLRWMTPAGRLMVSGFEFRETYVPIIIVEVMPKAELLDPQGKAVARALARTGESRFSDVRIGKRFELTCDGDANDAALAEARELADSLLSNSVIEDVVSVHFASAEVAAEAFAEIPNGHA